jgi:hypothetical protein
MEEMPEVVVRIIEIPSVVEDYSEVVYEVSLVQTILV